MPLIEYEGRQIRLDDEGFLADFEDWDVEVALALARLEGVGELPPASLDILLFMRKFYKEHHHFPILRAVCRNVHQPRDCVTEKFMDPVKAWKIAGLPNPGPEVNVFKTWEPLGY
jgi:tRNA 2-thiouridine synthesizing protein E